MQFLDDTKPALTDADKKMQRKKNRNRVIDLTIADNETAREGSMSL